ncbi:MAG: hypothetical protein PHH59_16840, partial [Methylovulum sp.]|nr:hypothetical protein [Methylovulum sp.]
MDRAVAGAIVAGLRETLYLPLDDLLYVTKTYINPDVSRSGLARCLKRHTLWGTSGISKLKDVLPPVEDDDCMDAGGRATQGAVAEAAQP